MLHLEEYKNTQQLFNFQRSHAENQFVLYRTNSSPRIKGASKTDERGDTGQF